eukprot:gene5292-8910_t
MNKSIDENENNTIILKSVEEFLDFNFDMRRIKKSSSSKPSEKELQKNSSHKIHGNSKKDVLLKFHQINTTFEATVKNGEIYDFKKIDLLNAYRSMFRENFHIVVPEFSKFLVQNFQNEFDEIKKQFQNYSIEQLRNFSIEKYFYLGGACEFEQFEKIIEEFKTKTKAVAKEIMHKKTEEKMIQNQKKFWRIQQFYHIAIAILVILVSSIVFWSNKK